MSRARWAPREAARRLLLALVERFAPKGPLVFGLDDTVERRRLSRILHDDLQQRLYGIQMRMTFIRKEAETAGHDELLEHADEVYTWIEEAFETTRNLTVDLSPRS